MKATLTLDFGDRLQPEESREVIAESMKRNVPLEDILTEAIRAWRKSRGSVPVVAAGTTTMVAA